MSEGSIGAAMPALDEQRRGLELLDDSRNRVELPGYSDGEVRPQVSHQVLADSGVFGDSLEGEKGEAGALDRPQSDQHSAVGRQSDVARGLVDEYANDLLAGDVDAREMVAGNH